VAIEGATLEVTGSFSLLRSGLTWNRITNKYSASITLTNTSGAAVKGPVQLTLDGLAAGVTLDNASGLRNGSPYVTLKDATIEAGASVTVPLTYSNPGKLPISYTNAVYIGIF
jgi:hypothetical protein